MRHNTSASVLTGLVLALFIVPGVFAQANRFEHDEDAVRGLRYAAWEAGTIVGSAASPYSRADLAMTLARTSSFAGSLSQEAIGALERVSTVLASKPMLDTLGFGASIGAQTAFEAYPRLYKNGRIGSPWGWNDRTPLVAIPIELYALQSVYARVTNEIVEDHNAIKLALDPPNSSNWIESLDYIDYTFPFESFVAIEFGPLSVSLGRDSMRWGPGHTGTLVLSDQPDYYDYMEAAITSERFSYHFNRVSIDPSLRPSEVAAVGTNLEPAKNLFLHRFEVLLGDRVALALIEGLMVGGVNPDIAYANPFLILHNRFAWNATMVPSASSVLSLELRYNPWRYMELYGSVAMNQLQTDYERERYAGAAEAIPGAYAWQAGGQGAYPYKGGWIRATLEYVFTNPWMYIRENSLTSYTWRRRLASNVVGADQLSDSYIGYRYGPDASVYFAALGWDCPGKLSFQTSAEYAECGEQDMYTAYDEGDDAVALKTPSGIVERITSLGLEASWFPRRGVDVYGSLVMRFIKNPAHQDGLYASALDARLGCIVSFPEIIRDVR